MPDALVTGDGCSCPKLCLLLFLSSSLYQRATSIPKVSPLKSLFWRRGDQKIVELVLSSKPLRVVFMIVCIVGLASKLSECLARLLAALRMIWSRDLLRLVGLPPGKAGIPLSRC